MIEFTRCAISFNSLENHLEYEIRKQKPTSQNEQPPKVGITLKQLEVPQQEW